MKFTLVGQHPVYSSFTHQKTSDFGDKITMEFDAEELDVVLENMAMFLRGCGFIIEGPLTVEQYD
jgi:hypothetical protein